MWRGSLKTEGYVVTDARSGAASVRDILVVRQMVQEGSLQLHWVPTWRQFGDGLTKAMQDELFTAFRRSGTLNIVHTAEDEKEEARRAELRKGQRFPRKLRMKPCGSA